MVHFFLMSFTTFTIHLRKEETVPVYGWKKEVGRGAVVYSRSESELLSKPDLEFMDGVRPVVSIDWYKDDSPILDLGGRYSSSPSFSGTRCQLYMMGFVPEDDSHCKVRSLPSVSSPSSSHLGFDGLTGKERKFWIKDLQIVDSMGELCPVELFLQPSLPVNSE